MTTTARTDINEALKVIFSEPVINNTVLDSEFMDIFQTDVNVRTEETTGGRYIESAHYFRLPGSVGARAEGDYLPVPEKPLFKNSRINLRKTQGVIEMNGDTMRRVKQDDGAFLNYMERALPDLVMRLKDYTDGSYIGTGLGVKARIAAAGISANGANYNVPIDRAYGVNGYTDPWVLFQEGQRLVASATFTGAVLKTGGGTVSMLVESIVDTPGGNVLVCSMNAALAADLAANDYLAFGDESGNSFQTAGGDNKEITGLLAAIDDGNIVATYANIARAGQRLWQSLVYDAQAGEFDGRLTEDLLVYADEETYRRGGGMATNLITSMNGSRQYWASLKSDRLFNDPRGNYLGGKVKGLAIVLGDRIINLRVSRKVSPQFTFGVKADSFKRITLGQFEWDDTTGSIWNRVTDANGRRDAFYAAGNMYEELFCMMPRHNYRIDNQVVGNTPV